MGIFSRTANRMGLFTKSQNAEKFDEGFDAGKIDRGTYGAAVSGPGVDFGLRPWVTAQTGQNPDRVLLREAGGSIGLDYYRDIIEKDQTIQTIVRRRKDRVLALDRDIVPSVAGEEGPDANDEKLARFTRWWMAELPKLKQVWEDMLEADSLGYSVEEIIWGDMVWEGMAVFVPIAIIKRDQNYFSFDISTHDLLYSPNQNFVQGASQNVDELFPGKFMRMSYGPTNNPWGEALVRNMHSQAWVKLNMAPGEMVALDRFGFGTLIAKMKAGATDAATKARLEKGVEILKTMQNSQTMAIPDDWDVELLEGAQVKGGETHHERRRDYADKQMAKSGLGGTLTTDHGNNVGSYSLGKVHMQGEDMIIVKSSDNLDEAWSDQVLKWAIIMNFGVQERYPKLEANTEMIKTSEAQLAEDETLQNMGYPLTVGYASRTYDRPIPDDVNPDDILVPVSTQANIQTPTGVDQPTPETFAEPVPESPHRKRAERQLDEYFAMINRARLEGIEFREEQNKEAAKRLEGAQTKQQVMARIPGEDRAARVKELEDQIVAIKMIFQLMARAHAVETQEKLEAPPVEEFQELTRLTRQEILESPFGQLLERFRERAAVTDATFGMMEQAARNEAFSFAGSADANTVAKAQDAFLRTLERGESVQDFAARAADEWNFSSSHLETVWKTNAQQAYTAGVDAQFEEFGPEEYPLAELVTQRDADVRDTHAIWDGFMADPDDPVWDMMAPLNDFNCRCQKVLIHATEVVEEGLRPTDKRIQARNLQVAPANPAFTD